MEGSLYILKSCKTGRFYIGSFIDVTKRLKEHNSGQVKATKYQIPWELLFQQKYSTIREARQVEYQLKQLKRRDIIERIIQDQCLHLKGR